jgi:hypothetical protein
VERDNRFSSKGIEAGMRIEELIAKNPKLAPVNPTPIATPPILLTNVPVKAPTNGVSSVTNK